MSVAEKPSNDLELGHRRRRSDGSRPSVAGSGKTTADGSLCFSDSDSDDQSWHSPVECRHPSASDCLSDDVDLESGDLELKVHSAKEQRDCRICHLNLVGGGDRESAGVAIELGCSCKGDLAAAHKQCAETWFKIRGNTTCEICGATALNVAGQPINEGNGATASATAALPDPAESRNAWHGRRVVNVLLAFMIFAFIISWLFHFNVIS
ncbi:uncharacterized protein LOC127796614 [Diospyros lotus]|uniref:uncharacterized protein LOC127796614 n=1 Tax=Diospyros lotus TaxID=55363 RepID=UPI002254A351|nr:uncharacterized protein LOC127796614 [Diospyros lotus]